MRRLLTNFERFPEWNPFLRRAGDFIMAEVKQARPSLRSPFRRLMRELRIAPVHFSKYCYGIYLFHPEERHNRLKRNYLALERKKNLWLTPQIL